MRPPPVRLVAACLLAAGCGACGGSGGPTGHPSGGGAHRVGDLAQPRAAHTATTLADGRVLVTGGYTTAGPATADAWLVVP